MQIPLDQRNGVSISRNFGLKTGFKYSPFRCFYKREAILTFYVARVKKFQMIDAPQS